MRSADLVRVGAALSVAIASYAHGALGFALFFLVLGGCVLSRVLGVGRWVDLATCSVLLAAAWAAQLDWYVAVPWLDLVAHGLATALVAVLAAQLLGRSGSLPDPARSGAGWPLALVVTGLGALGAVLWEAGEWFGHAVVDERIQVGYDDTMSDLLLGVLGSLVAGMLLARQAVRAAHTVGAHAVSGQGAPSVSVVIPVRDDAAALEVCLQRLSQQSLAPTEVVVVDNASSDDSAGVARRHGARVVTEPVVGIGAAAAAGYDAATGDIILRCDADTLPGPRWVELLVRELDDADLDVVTGLGYFHDVPRGLRAPLAVGYLGAYYVLTHLALGHTAIWGSNMALRRRSWLAVRDQVHREDPEVHDDMDLAFALGPRSRIRLVGVWVGVSARALHGRAQRKRRLDRARRTLTLNWQVSPPWLRWRDHYRSRTIQISSWVSRKPVR
ncbi:glycosyltransferase family 2 protein [Nocardioides sp. zg-ZUI104]|uniref:glycosyltransferase family 2 protein n=1 Tax=Nocardioides faecalis TaxID=2803858 RepID=UPI001BD0F072|nr:glycosyltransferase family 2 protein [Nocardioides faecalis]MBS4753984.1 glycosyltransferase family 2 protein [Nocardioides faecalis]